MALGERILAEPERSERSRPGTSASLAIARIVARSHPRSANCARAAARIACLVPLSPGRRFPARCGIAAMLGDACRRPERRVAPRVEHRRVTGSRSVFMSTPATTHERGLLANRAAYWFTLIGVYFLVGVLFFYSGKGKLFDDNGHAPPALKKQFQGTFIDKVPGVDTAWVILGILEFAIFALIVLSIVTGEFLPHKRKSLLLVGLALGFVTFACLSFGQTSIGNNEGTASLYSYFASTAIIFLLVRRLPPNGAGDWLATPADRRE
jgi:hypothetical protein